MASLVWLVTGSTSGFGAEFVKSLLAKGDKVIATARNTSKLTHLQEAGAAILKLDLTADQTDFDKVAEAATAIYGGVDVLVNNAGYSHFSTIEDDRYDFIRWIMLRCLTSYPMTAARIGSNNFKLMSSDPLV